MSVRISFSIKNVSTKERKPFLSSSFLASGGIMLKRYTKNILITYMRTDDFFVKIVVYNP